MSLQLTTPPASEPVSLDDAKAWLKVETDDEDALITALIPAARARCEWQTGRAFITQSWTLWLDGIGEGAVEIPLPPLASVTSMTLYDTGDAATMLDAARYQLDRSGGRLVFKDSHPELRAFDAVAIAFTCGYGAASDVPDPLKTAILQVIASLYEHRGDTTAPTPDAALALMAPYRNMKI